MKILIDNGLGRDTTGKRSPDGRLLEWSYTREIARRVVAELQAQHYYASLLVPEARRTLQEGEPRLRDVYFDIQGI